MYLYSSEDPMLFINGLYVVWTCSLCGRILYDANERDGLYFLDW